MKVAKLSFSHKPFHHCMVTRLPNHIWAISCMMVLAMVFARGRGELAAPDQVFVEDHRSDVFHRVEGVFRCQDLVILEEWIGDAEIAFEEPETGACPAEPVIDRHMSRE